MQSHSTIRQGNLALIGGTGFEQLPPDIYSEKLTISTSFGEVELLSVSDNYTEPNKLYFLSRHGAGHHAAPHQVNYRANILALKKCGVTHILASNAVGSLRKDWGPGTFLLLSNFIDFTHQRPLTLSEEQWSHIDFSTPYSFQIRQVLQTAAQELNTKVQMDATYLCCDGPRFETPAEVKLFRSWGADVVGMTGLPEVVFAKEAGIEYGAVALVTNLGAGLSEKPIDHLEVSAKMAEHLLLLQSIMFRAAALLCSETTN